MSVPTRGLFSSALCSFCSVVLLLAACSSNSSESVQGDIALPGGGAASGPLWVVAQGLDGTTYGSVASAEGGHFALNLQGPEGAAVMLAAVDPKNPGNLALALTTLGSQDAASDPSPSSTSQGLGRSRFALGEGGPLRIDAATTAGVLLRIARGELATPASDAAAAVIESLVVDLEAQGTRACSVGPTGLAADAVRSIMADRPMTASGRFDEIAEGSDPLIDRLRAAQSQVTDRVISANKLNAVNIWVKLPVGIIGLSATRLAIKATTSLSLLGFGKDRISEAELALVGEQVMGAGFGNCREKGLTAAFLATRFPEVKQIAVVGVTSNKFWSAHALAIACTGDKGVYDLGNYAKDLDAGEGIIPPGLADAGCVVIDPWLGETEPLTAEYVSSQEWISVANVLLVDREGAQAPAPQTIPDELPMCRAQDPAGDPCQPFEIEIEAPPDDPDPPLPPGYSLAGSCQASDGLTCGNLYGIGGADLYKNACEGTWRDGPCPEGGALGACRILAQGILAQVRVEYFDPSNTEDDEATQAAEARTKCEQGSQANIESTWQRPYRAP